MTRPYSKDKDNCPGHSFDGDGYCIECDTHFNIYIEYLRDKLSVEREEMHTLDENARIVAITTLKKQSKELTVEYENMVDRIYKIDTRGSPPSGAKWIEDKEDIISRMQTAKDDIEMKRDLLNITLEFLQAIIKNNSECNIC